MALPEATLDYTKLKKTSNTAEILSALNNMEVTSILFQMRDNLTKFTEETLTLMSNTARTKFEKQKDNFLSATLTMIDFVAKDQNIAGISNGDISKLADNISKKLLPTIANQQTAKRTTTKAAKPTRFIVKSTDATISCDTIVKEIAEIAKSDPSIQLTEVKKGLTAVKVSTTQSASKTKVINKLKERSFGPKLEMKNVEMLLPQVSVIIEEYSCEDAEMIKKRNDIPDSEEVKIVTTYDLPQRNKTNKKKVIIRLSRQARQIIEDRGRINIGCESVRFKDNYYIKTCTNCISIGHTKNQCNNAATCYKCEQDHVSSSCEADPQNNCLLCKKINDPKLNLKHKPKSSECLAYHLAIKNLQSLIDWDYENDQH